MSVLGPVTTVYGTHGMVASADGLATQAGLAVLRRGGNAVDAAIATNAMIAVTAPHLCGMGGDLFALVHEPGATTPAALDAAGSAGHGADPDRLLAEGHDSMPFRLDIRSVTVPGCVDGWLALHERYGTLPLAELLADATRAAREGFPASPLLAASVTRLDAALAPAAAALVQQARRPGDLVRRPGVAEAVGAIARSGRDGWYGGAFGEGLLALGAGEHTAEYTAGDLAERQARWVTPLSVDAWGHRVWSMPPTSQGYVTLASAAIAAGLPLPDTADGQWAHLLVEAAVQAGHDRPDVLHQDADGGALIGAERLSARRDAIRPDRASRLGAWGVAGDTTYLCVLDGQGMGVSLIQSNASGFGSHLFEPNTGVNLHNRGIGFTVEPGHPARYGPGRRPPHTLCPALVTRSGGALYAVLGTQGGDGQPQILLQVLARLLQLGQSPAAAIASPRWVLTGSGQGFDTWTAAGGPAVVVEDIDTGWAEPLTERGHRVQAGTRFDHGFGHAHLIVADPRGALSGSADPRARVGSCAAW